jgi:hypothetical protein
MAVNRLCDASWKKNRPLILYRPLTINASKYFNLIIFIMKELGGSAMCIQNFTLHLHLVLQSVNTILATLLHGAII